MTDPQKFIDRMLEAENLTDYLEDEDADYLIDWGVTQLREKLGQIEDDSIAGEFANNLMGFIRKLNQIAGNLENVLPANVFQLADRHQKAFGGPERDLIQSDYLKPASDLVVMTPRQAIDYLLKWPFPEEKLPSEESPSSNNDQSSEEDSSSE